MHNNSLNGTMMQTSAPPRIKYMPLPLHPAVQMANQGLWCNGHRVEAGMGMTTRISGRYASQTWIMHPPSRMRPTIESTHGLELLSQNVHLKSFPGIINLSMLDQPQECTTGCRQPLVPSRCRIPQKDGTMQTIRQGLRPGMTQ